MKRLLAVSDLHGCHEEFVQLLEKVRYDPIRDQLILLGDYIDRGPDSMKVVETCIELQKEGAICLLGNHEDMMMGSFIPSPLQPHYADVWLQNGGFTTLRSYGLESLSSGLPNKLAEHLHWMASLPLYHETEDFIFVHASPDPGIPIQDQSEALIWGRHFGTVGLGKLVIHGHTPQKQVRRVNDQLFIDTGGAFGQHFSIVELCDPNQWNITTVDGYKNAA